MTEHNFEIKPDSMRSIKHAGLVLITALAIMIIFDQLIYDRQWGLQFLITTLLVLIGLCVLVLVEKKSVPWQSLLLLVPILFGAVMTIFRREESSTIFNILLVLSSLMLLAMTLLNGQWLRYRMREVLMGILLLIQSVLIDPIRLLISRHATAKEQPQTEKHAGWKKVWPYLRGVLIALPLLLAFGALLSSADLIFKDRLGNLFAWMKFENFSEFIGRSIYVLILAYLLAGAYIHALTRSAEEKTLSPDKELVKPFLGYTEAITVLTLVNLLFLGFLIVQFRYFFAGQANISLQGFTYAEYARRGFFELLAVTLISLGLHYLLDMFTKRSTDKEKRTFSALELLLILQVGVMLVSAFQRLSLYEAAYGFTTLRTLTHIFMIWLGVLLAASALMQLFKRFNRLALVFFLVFFGFTLTLSLVNVDKFIAQRNIEHAIAGNPLDARYLVHNLSDDGIPTLFEYWERADMPDEIKRDLNATLACSYISHNEREEDRDFWASWHASTARANALFDLNSEELSAYPFIKRSENTIYFEDGKEFDVPVETYSVMVDGEEIWCGDKLLP